MTQDRVSDEQEGAESPFLLYRGVLIRPDVASDRTVVQEQRGYDALQLASRRVLDVGAHIGAFVVKCQQAGAEFVLAVEPHPDNVRVLEANADPGTTVIWQAAVTPTRGKVPLYLADSPGNGPCTHSTVAYRGRTRTIEVEGWPLFPLLDTMAVEVLKMDIEGGEFDLLEELDDLPSHVKQIGMEVHYGRLEWRMKIPALFASFERQGFKRLDDTVARPGDRGVVYCWARP